MKISPSAGQLAEVSMLVNVPKLVSAYYTEIAEPSVSAQRVTFGTSGYRRSAFQKTFNEWHVLSISQTICQYRKQRDIDGPLFLGIDTRALSVSASASALEVPAANDMEVMIADNDEYTPTLAVPHAMPIHTRPFSTEDIYRIYAESFQGVDHLRYIVPVAS